MNLIKNIFFLLHIFGILICIFLFLVYWQVLILQAITIISWKLNNNKCLLTEMEDYLFGETVIDIYFKFFNINISVQKHNSRLRRFVVPEYQRYLVYCIFLIGIFYHIIILK